MTSDMELREVAVRLRSYIPDRSCMISTAVAIGAFDVDTISNRVSSEDVLRIADLIDRTCHLDLTDVETYGNAKVRTYECSECGRTCEEIYGKYERCPHCGARVVSGDE